VRFGVLLSQAGNTFLNYQKTLSCSECVPVLCSVEDNLTVLRYVGKTVVEVSVPSCLSIFHLSTWNILSPTGWILNL
jgi:hypothetical protein